MKKKQKTKKIKPAIIKVRLKEKKKGMMEKILLNKQNKI